MALSPENLRVLAVDVGYGTSDLLLYDGQKRPENNIKMVFPSRAQILAKNIMAGRGDLLLYGETMGGGPLTAAVSSRIKGGDRVFMTPKAAMSIRDDLRKVEAMGVQITDEIHNLDCEKIETKDIDFEIIKNVLLSVGEKFDFDCLGVAVQDHGHGPGKSDRVFRFEKIRDALKKGASVHNMMYEKPPKYYTRMNGALRTVKRAFKGKAFVVDTKIAAISGAIWEVNERPVLSIDIGNGHTMVAIVGDNDEILGMFEHHTDMLSKETLEYFIERFIKGNLTNEEVYNNGGHGCYIRDTAEVRRTRVTGPKRNLLLGSRLKIEFASPLGDAMMCGPAGIVRMASRLYSNP